MISAAQFQKESTFFAKGHKNPIAGDLQTLLNAYESGTTTPNRKLKLLVMMYFLCQEYFRSKDKTKKTFDPASHPKNKVVRLMRDIEQEFASAAFNAQLQAKAQGEHYKGGQLARAASAQGTELHGQYKTELLAPQKNLINKLQLNTPMKSFGMSALYQVIEQEFQEQGMQAQAAATAAHAAVAQMTLPEVLRKIHSIWSRDAHLGVPQFNFYNAAQRQAYAAVCTGGVIACNGKNPYSSQRYGRDDKVMYVLDTANHLYIADGLRVGDGSFNHSSMLAGAPVLCAGEVMVNAAGRLIYIDNNSGHYKPNTDALISAVRFLMQHWGLHPSTFQVYNKVTDHTQAGDRFWQRPDARRFVMGGARH
jgi:hypothetical protein